MARAEPAPVCLIHIGKTGGTYVQEVIRASQAPGSGGVHLPGHIPLKQAIADYGAGLRFGFVFRDPLARFTSGFYSRLRMGRPQRQVIWNAGEAAAFSYFTSANDLAEALDSTDARQQSAAVFSLRAIRHLKRGYGYHFGTPKAFLAEVPDRLAACVDIAHLDARLEPFLAHLGVAKVVLPDGTKTRDSAPYDGHLSERAVANLRTHWAEEFRFFEIFQSIEAEFFSGK